MTVEQALDTILKALIPFEMLQTLKEQGFYEIILSERVKSGVSLYEALPYKFVRWTFKDYHNFVQGMSSYLNKGSVLEIAFGMGGILINLVKKGFSPIYGIEVSSAQVEAVKKKLCNCESEVHLIQARAELFDYGTLPKVNNIIMKDFWGFLPPSESIDLLHNLKKCLAEDGQIIIGPYQNKVDTEEVKEAHKVLREEIGLVLDYDPLYNFNDFGFKYELIEVLPCFKFFFIKPT